MKSNKKFHRVTVNEVHQKVMSQLIKTHHPKKSIASIWVQWLSWIALSIAGMSIAVWVMGKSTCQMSMMSNQQAHDFLIISILGAALAGWKAIASSIPGRITKNIFKIILTVTLILVVVFPIYDAHFYWNYMNLFTCVIKQPRCFGCVLALSAIPWIVLGFLISKNAPLQPMWTGIWVSMAAFLMGMGISQLLYPICESCYVMAIYGLSFLIMILIALLIGTWWFSKWKK